MRLDRAFIAKRRKVRQGVYNLCCWDTLLFNHLRLILGGMVRLIIHGGSSVREEVIEFFKMAFSCPVVQCYGLTESCGGVTLTPRRGPDAGDNVGHAFEPARIKIEQNVSTASSYQR